MSKASENQANQIENARVGYSAAMSRSIHSAQMFWLRSSTMLAANAILTAATGWLFKTYITQDTRLWVRFASCIMPTIGILLCVLWIALMKRTMVFYDYWIGCAKGLEGTEVRHL